jgi:hypothetical protein
MLVITIVIIVAYIFTFTTPIIGIQVPLWLAIFPALFVLLYMARVGSNLMSDYQSEKLEYTLSGMSKRDYLNYKIGDDRTAKSFAASATSAGVLSGANILGPFLRADR